MAVTAEENAIAEKVVEKSKREAQVDTGRLKRSINKKVQRGIITFRQYFYGIYEDHLGTPNSTLEDNAKKMMGNIPYKIELLDNEGNVLEERTRLPSGRQISIDRKTDTKKAISKANALIAKVIAKRDAEKEDNNKDNRRRT